MSKGSIGPLPTTVSRWTLPDWPSLIRVAVILFEEGLGDRVAWTMAADPSPMFVIESAWKYRIRPARDRARTIARQRRRTRRSAGTP